MFLFLVLLKCAAVSLAFNKTSKRGLSFPAANNPADVLNINQTKSQVSWVYDWGLDIPSYLSSSRLEYIPMQWGAGNIENLAATLKEQGSKVVLGFNEPDFSQQSNLDPAYAAQLWTQYFNPLKGSGIRIGAPSVSSSGTGQPWLTQFFAACTDCQIDFLPVHWYGVGTAGFYDYLYSVHGQFPNLTLWVTEYADTSLNGTDVLTFLNQTSVYLDSLEWVERYAWFGYFRPENGSAYNFLDADGGLNSLGKAYVGADTVVKSGPVASTAPPANIGGPTKSYTTLSVPTGAYTPTFTSSDAAPVALLRVQAFWSLIAFIFTGLLSIIWTAL